ncbi:MAG TPA: S8 family peptidase [Chloroflexota bacterium]
MTRRRVRAVLAALLSLTLLLSSQPSLFAQQPERKLTAAQPLTPESSYQSEAAKTPSRAGMAVQAATDANVVGLIVQLQDESLASYSGGIPGLAPTNARVTGAPRLDPTSSQSQAYLQHLTQQQDTFEANAAKAALRARITHRFDIVLNAVAVQVPADQVAAVARLPGVKAVYPDELLRLETDNSPQFLGAPAVWRELGGQASAGEGVIVGVLDTGVWPEHPSFRDPDPGGKPYPAPPPPPPSVTRRCQFSGGGNPGPAFTCNNKLIGAQRFMATYDFFLKLKPGEFTTARDDNGHGTHTSSTAAGNGGVAASIFDIPRGTISGIAPRAHVMAYKVCGDAGCFTSDSAAAVQEAIRDGVNVINFSISGGSNPYSDAVERAFLDAYNAGVFVAASAGNSGPGADTTDHRGPWVTTVAASTQNRAFVNRARLTSSDLATLTLPGTSLTQGIGARPVTLPPATGTPPATDVFCLGPYAPGTFTGKIVVCQRGGGIGRVQKGFNVLQGGAVGMILYNNAANVTDLETDNHFLPATHIQFAQGQTLLAFMAAHPGVQASLTQGVAAPAVGDVMASFSSRGGPGQTLGVSKPDVTAPGVQVLAGHTPQSVEIATGPTGQLFQAIAGTSMSSPHVAGAAALLKDLHPTWTPGQIKSALMTTARTAVVKEDGTTPTDAFDDGSGRIRLNRADQPGLTFDESGARYLALQNNLWNANYPSVFFPVMTGQMTVERTAHNTLPFAARWTLKATGPGDVEISVPEEIAVPANGNTTFKITVDARDVPLGQVRFAQLILTERGPGGGEPDTLADDAQSTGGDERGQDGNLRGLDRGNQQLHIPITLVRAQPVVGLNKSCTPASIRINDTTHCTIAATNNSFNPATVSISDRLPRQLGLVAATLKGATPAGNGLTFSGLLAPAQPPNVAIASAPGSSPAGYLPLSDFGVPPIANMSDESLVNLDVPAFTYGGETYTRIGVVSNGYAVVGGGTNADIQFLNQNLPNPTRPNNVLAPFWTDLNPTAGGAVRIGSLTDGADTWIVIDWGAVREFSAARTDSFQIWIGVNGDAHPGQDITFTYGALQGNGDGGLLTVGAENRFGNRGGSYYFDGAGTLPTTTTELQVSGAPGGPGETHKIEFDARGERAGAYVNYAEMASDLFEGLNIARFAGNVTR